MTFYVGRFETASFDFVAYAETPEMARELLRKQWAKHRRQTGAWLTWADISEWVIVTETQMNTAHRR